MIFETLYLGELRTETTHPKNGSILLTDAPLDNQGKGECFSPTDLIAVAFASCALTLMGIEAKRIHVDIKGLKVLVEKRMESRPIRRIAAISLHFLFPHPLDPEVQEKLEKAAKTCPVHASLHPDVQQLLTFTWGNT